jgi:hypothetical protein
MSDNQDLNKKPKCGKGSKNSSIGPNNDSPTNGNNNHNNNCNNSTNNSWGNFSNTPHLRQQASVPQVHHQGQKLANRDRTVAFPISPADPMQLTLRLSTSGLHPPKVFHGLHQYQTNIVKASPMVEEPRLGEPTQAEPPILAIPTIPIPMTAMQTSGTPVVSSLAVYLALAVP